MNTNYYPNPNYPNINNGSGELTAMGGVASNPNSTMSTTIATDNMLPIEQSYIENILRLNRGKLATLYFSFPDSVEWRDKTFTGVIEAAGRDHIIISDPKTGKWYMLLMIYLNYAEFEEKINYNLSYYPKV